jgi:prepilin-type processing-associated H-X9-DG protein
MYCPKCGTENPDDAQLCRSCSWVLTSTPTQAPSLGVKTSGLAIAALALGILSFFTFFITALPAIILGIVGLLKIGKSGGKLKGSGFAVSGIVVSALVLLMGVSIVLNFRYQVFRMWCGTNMAVLGMEMLVYCNDYDDKFPTTSKWSDLLVEHTDVTEKGLRCPGVPAGPCNYAINKNIEELGAQPPPDDMVVLFETHPGWNQSGGPEILTTDNHQGEGCNVLFMDSHVDFIKTEDLDGLKWKPGSDD